MFRYDSIACLSAAAAMYIVAPDLTDSSASAQASAATNNVFPFFRGIKINASFMRRSFDPGI